MQRTIAFGLGAVLVLLTAVFAQQGQEPLKKVETAKKKAAPARQEKAKKPLRVKECEEVEEQEREDLLRGLPKQLEELIRKLDGLHRTPLRSLGFGTRGFKAGADSSVKVEVGPKGVRVEIKEKKDGKEEVEVYEAESVEAFKRNHPKIARKYGIGGTGFNFRLGPDFTPFRGFGLGEERLLREKVEELRRLIKPGHPSWKRLNRSAPFFMQPGDKRGQLGVMVQDVAPALADYLDLEPGLGFLVSEVNPGSLAQRAGVKVKDLVIAVDGREVRGVPSIRKALLSHPEGEKVKITVLRKGRKMILEAEPTKAGKKKQNIEVKKLKRL